jgi:hypothetical protein
VLGVVSPITKRFLMSSSSTDDDDKNIENFQDPYDFTEDSKIETFPTNDWENRDLESNNWESESVDGDKDEMNTDISKEEKDRIQRRKEMEILIQGYVDKHDRAVEEILKSYGLGGLGFVTFLAGYLQGGATGFLLGGTFTIFTGFISGMNRIPGFGRLVLRQSTYQFNSLGMLVGSYSGSVEVLKAYRGKHDVYNVFGSGFIAGALSGASSRNPRRILTSALGLGGAMGALHLLGFAV